MKLQIVNVTRKFGDFRAVENLNLTIENGVYGLLGVNGAGKTTLMRMICTLLPPTSGRILCDGKDIFKMDGEYRNLLGYLPQEFGFYPDFTVKDYLLYIASLKGIRPMVAGKRVKDLLAQVGLTKSANKKMKKLSGGMKRRAGIAQAMLNNPKILILDEPTAGLDPKGRDDILDQIAELHKVRGITIILVSHSMEDIAKYAERLIVVNDGEIAYDDAPKAVFAHYRELEAMGLAAPQITYIMHALKEKGLDVDVTATTVDEAKENILAVLRKCNPGKLSGDRQSVSDSQSKKENAKAETLISEMEADLTEDGTKESHSDAPDEDLSIQKETMDKKSAEQEENEGGQEV